MLKNISENPLRRDPEKISLIENAFPEEFYQNLLNNLPNENLYDSIDGTSLKIFKLDASYINRLPGSEIPFWSQLEYELGSNDQVIGLVEGLFPQLDAKKLKLTAVIVQGDETQLNSFSAKSLIALHFNLDGGNDALLNVQGRGLETGNGFSSQHRLIYTIDI